MVVKINVRYFASVREQLGAGEQIVLSGVRPPATVGELRAWLIARSPAHALVLDPTRGLRTAFNQTLCGPDHLLEDGAEVAFFPPVTGG
jgi:molybdopterin synthase sulfur carrier subunit